MPVLPPTRPLFAGCVAVVVLLGTAVVGAAGSASASSPPTYRVSATVPAGTAAFGVAVDPSTHTAYVVNRSSNNVTVIDGTTNTVTATVPVGANPFGVAVDPSTHTAYVTNFNSGSVSVINGGTRQVTATIPVGGFSPLGIAVGPLHRHRVRGGLQSATRWR